MVNTSSPETLDAVFAALADPTRRAILARLIVGESTVTELAKPFEMSLPAVSKHLRILEKAGLLKRQKSGRIHRIALVALPMQEAAEWLTNYRAFWTERFDTLAALLEEESANDEHTGVR